MRRTYFPGLLVAGEGRDLQVRVQSAQTHDLGPSVAGSTQYGDARDIRLALSMQRG